MKSSERMTENNSKKAKTEPETGEEAAKKRADRSFPAILTLAANLMLVNILTLLLCLPILTAGAAVTAMADVLLRISEGDDSGVTRAFFSAFRADFTDATMLYVFYLPVIAADLTYIALVLTGTISANAAVFYILAAVTVIMTASAVYAAALTARYKNGAFATFRNSLLLAFGYFPRTLLIVISFWVAGALIYTGWPYSGSLGLLFGLSVPGYRRPSDHTCFEGTGRKTGINERQ